MALTHLDEEGKAKMVDVTDKPVTRRLAIARGTIYLQRDTLKMIEEGRISKGNVFEVAKIAGILAAKQTSSLIPLCHPLNITNVEISFTPLSHESRIDIESRVSLMGQTGAEMEALTSLSVAALTIYDMCKGVDKNLVISDLHLVHKSGGKSGDFWFSAIPRHQG
ncbi:MAG: cyclic pyranopterin monophosphate synthase MoaC [Candidatus Tectomicrobia bacterium]|nr:cyclic pyranopterin monophosphate synthase MoaC [Candidatus Tectomicrobia bacterium]